MPNYLPSRSDIERYKAVPNEIYQFQEAVLEAEHPPEGDATNKVATTGWVNAFVSGETLKPRILKHSDLAIRVSNGSVNHPNGGICNVTASLDPIGVASSESPTALRREYVWVRYKDCGVIVVTRLPDEAEGVLLGYVDIDQDKIVNIHNISHMGLAPIVDPIFDGTPQVPTPPFGDNSKTIPNTEWVQDELLGLIEEFNKLKEDLKDDLDVYKDLFTDSSVLPNEYPIIVPWTGLSVRVMEGKIPMPDFPSGITCEKANCLDESNNCHGDYCWIDTTNISIPASSDNLTNPKKRIWLRYEDCAVISTEEMPPLDKGHLIAEVFSNEMEITHIHQLAGTPERKILQGLKATYGGNLMFQDPPTETNP